MRVMLLVGVLMLSGCYSKRFKAIEDRVDDMVVVYSLDRHTMNEHISNPIRHRQFHDVYDRLDDLESMSK